MIEETRDITFISHYSEQCVPAGGTCMLLARPQIPLLEPYKLFIPAWCADAFTIEDVRVGNRSMFPRAQSLTAEQFSHGDGHLFKCEKLMVAMDFLMMVTNHSGMQRHFRASWACYLPKYETPAFEEHSLWSKIPSPLDALKRATEETLAKGREVIQRAKDSIEDRAREVMDLKPRQPRQLPKPKDPPSFGWDPGYGDD